MIIGHNMEAMSALRYSFISSNALTKSSEKLSTGYKINRSADNAAGLQISEKMRAQIRGLDQASANAQDGISFVQTVDGALNEVQSLIQRGRELCVQAANDTNANADRDSIQEEIDAITEEVNRISKQTEFNTISCFPPDGVAPSVEASPNVSNYKINVNLSNQTISVATSSAEANSVLADKLAKELIPNAVDQILDAFPSLDTASTSFNLDLKITNIDGANNTLAKAQISYYTSTGEIVSYSLLVDSSDFTDADAEGTGANSSMLESTIAHEMMHEVMYYALRDGMTAYGSETYPQWFVEGAAQVVGGGFPTHWNDTLIAIEQSAASSATKDSNVINYLNDYTPSSRPYGHGYLATAYLGYLASGSSTVSSASISSGLDKIFSSMMGGSTLDQAIANNTSFSNAAAVDAAFAAPSAGLVSFVRSLAAAGAAGGAGSAIASSLTSGVNDIINNNTSGLKTLFVVNGTTPSTPGGGTTTGSLSALHLQLGANSGQSISFDLYDMSASKLGIDSVLVSNNTSAGNGISSYDDALSKVSKVRSYYGAIQNRLEHSMANCDNTSENLQAAESRIRDVDMAKEMTVYSKYNIVLQAGQAMMAQANQSKEGVLALLQ